MTDLFGRLARRALGPAAAVRPITPPVFGPPPGDPAGVAGPEAVTPATAPSAAVEASGRPPARGDLSPVPGERLARPSAIAGSPAEAERPSRRRARTVTPESAPVRHDRAPSASRSVSEAAERPAPLEVAPARVERPTPKPGRVQTGEPGRRRRPTGDALAAVAESAPTAALALAPRPPGGELSAISPRPRIARRDGRGRQDRGGESLTLPPAAPPIIRVTIGRVEVRAAAPPAPPVRLPERQPTLSLDDYLVARREGRR